MSGTCKACQGSYDWAKTPGGELMPVDAGSAGQPGGNLAVWREDGELRCRVLRKDEVPASGERLGTNHWGTCTQPGRFRKGRGR